MVCNMIDIKMQHFQICRGKSAPVTLVRLEILNFALHWRQTILLDCYSRSCFRNWQGMAMLDATLLVHVVVTMGQQGSAIWRCLWARSAWEITKFPLASAPTYSRISYSINMSHVHIDINKWRQFCCRLILTGDLYWNKTKAYIKQIHLINTAIIIRNLT